MSSIFDLLFQHTNRFNERHTPGPDDTRRHTTPQHHNIFSELDRIMHEMMREHFQSMNTFLSPDPHHFHPEDKSQDSNLRDRMLKNPDKDYHEYPGRNYYVPNKDIDLDGTIQNNPKLIDQIFEETPPTQQPSNQFRHQEFNPFSQFFTPQNSQSGFTFQSVVVTRGEDGKLKYEKREIREDADGNRQETITSSDDDDNNNNNNDDVGQQFLQRKPIQYQNRITSPGLFTGQYGVFSRIKDWFYPPNN
ncbi:hypothetical protein LOD99_10230 [Oopsacas minuta]|uniref:Uncharacterized protein n=1 Tax=Oopsacas minuta TaxID=111878 RepID=A0AAV7KHL6_9METZ|nr:hypothetical protein LOD99_10230 [Oopsacas minuta]